MSAPRSAAAAAALQDVARSALVLRWLTPQDMTAHRERLATVVSGGGTYYPEDLRYAPVDVQPTRRLIDIAQRLAGELAEPLRSVVLAELERTKASLAVVEARDDDQLSLWSLEQYGLPPLTACEAAAQLLGLPSEESESPRDMTSSDLAQKVTAALAAYTIDGWAVQIEPSMASRASVNGSRHLIRIREGLQLSEDEVNRLVVHEIGGHVLRWTNAWMQRETLLAVPMGNTTPTEEGLAVLLEQHMRVSSDEQLRTYAARVLAVVRAQHVGVVEVAQTLLPHVGLRSAVEIAFRVKRGLRDPNRPGGLTKDHGYLSGLVALKNLDRGSLRLLQATKWPLELLGEMRALTDTSIQVMVPDGRLLGG